VAAAKGGKQCSGKQAEFKVCLGSDCIAPDTLIDKFNYTQVTGIATIAVEDPVSFASNPITELVMMQVIQDLCKLNVSRVHVALAPDSTQSRTVKAWWAFLVPNVNDVLTVIYNLLAVQYNPVLCSKALRRDLQRAEVPAFQNVTQFIVLRPLPNTTEKAQPNATNVTANVTGTGHEDNHSTGESCGIEGPTVNASFREVASVFPVKEKGFCVASNGDDVNDSTSVLLPGEDGHRTRNDIECCPRICFRAAIDARNDPKNHKKVTGCEVIWGQSNAGCYVHRSDRINHGNGVEKHMCWIIDQKALDEAVRNMNIKTHNMQNETNKTKSTRVNGIIKLDVPTPSTFAESSTDAFQTLLSDLMGCKKEEVHISAMPDVALSSSGPRGGCQAWFSVPTPLEDTQEKADADATAFCQVLNSQSHDTLSYDLNNNLRYKGLDSMASVQVTDCQCKPQTNSSTADAKPKGKAQKVTGTMELVVAQQDPQQFAFDYRAREGVRTTLADFAETDVEHVQVSLYPPLPTLNDTDADPKALARVAQGNTDSTLTAWFVCTLPAEPAGAYLKRTLHRHGGSQTTAKMHPLVG